MKVLVLKANYFPVCGAGQLLKTLLAHVDTARIEPVLVEVATAGQPSSVHFASPELRHFEHHTVPWHGARRSASSIAQLRELVRQSGAAVVYSHDMRCDLLCRLAGAGRGLAARWVAHVHGYAGSAGNARLRTFEFVDRLCNRSADAVFVGSHHAERDVRRMLPRRVPLHCFPNTVDPSTALAATLRAPAARRALGLPDSAFLVGMHARMHRGKGHELLAESVLRCADERVHAVLLGYGDEEPRLRELAASPRARGRIHVVGRQEPIDTLATVAALDLFAYASLRESLPLAVLEAMWLRRPIVTTDVGDLATLLSHGDAGVLVKALDIAAMATAIESLANDAARRTALATRAYEIVSTRFDPEQFGAAITTALAAIGGGSR